MKPTDLALHLSAFLAHYLPGQRNLSPNTIRGYRDAFVLLLRYCRQSRRLPPERLCLDRLDASLIVEFLEYLERKRGCSARTRNQRLAALHSFFRFVQTEEPQRLAQCQRILAIPLRRVSCVEPQYLSSEDLAAVLDQPDLSTRGGRRDAVLLSVLYDTGARVQELIDLSVRDVRLSAPAQVRLIGKGRKTRLVPLMANTAKLLGGYLREQRLEDSTRQDEPVFRNVRGERLSRWGVRYLVKKYSSRARAKSSTLPGRISPHSLRHSKAMHLMQCGIPPVVIRDILGHADIQSTAIYARADLQMKQRALEQACGSGQAKSLPSWQRDPDLLEWLRSL